jgi:hypothetical protein
MLPVSGKYHDWLILIPIAKDSAQKVIPLLPIQKIIA